MNLEKLIKSFTILEFISSNPNCRAPDIRDFLGILHTTKPNNEEKEFYQILTILDRDGYVLKLPIVKLGSGGAHFSLSVTAKGKELLTQIENFSSKSLKDKGRYPEDKSRNIMLDIIVTDDGNIQPAPTDPGNFIFVDGNNFIFVDNNNFVFGG